MFYFSQVPGFIQRLFPSITWRIPTTEPIVYLTFDDGPIPEVTPWVLDMLAKHNAKATFFCVGENVERNHTIFQTIKEQGHVIGNHTFSHKSGWKLSTEDYLLEVEKCAQLVDSQYFRPPYGRLSFAQYRKLKHKYKIIYWDVLTSDFDMKLTAEDCLEIVKKHTRAGSILVLHDSQKAWPRLEKLLPAILKLGAEKGWIFRSL